METYKNYKIEHIKIDGALWLQKYYVYDPAGFLCGVYQTERGAKMAISRRVSK